MPRFSRSRLEPELHSKTIAREWLGPFIGGAELDRAVVGINGLEFLGPSAEAGAVRRSVRALDKVVRALLGQAAPDADGADFRDGSADGVVAQREVFVKRTPHVERLVGAEVSFDGFGAEGALMHQRGGRTDAAQGGHGRIGSIKRAGVENEREERVEAMLFEKGAVKPFELRRVLGHDRGETVVRENRRVRGVDIDL